MKSYEEMLNYVENYLIEHNAIKHANPVLNFRNRFWHTRRVLEWAKKIVVDYPDCDSKALYTAAVFHDIGYARGKQNHAIIGAEIFEEYAQSAGFDNEFTAFVAYLIRFHSSKDLLNDPKSPIELVLLQEADLLDEEGAMGIVFDVLAYTRRYPDNVSFYGVFEEINKHSYHILEQDFMVTPLARKYWKEKQDLVRSFVESYSKDLFVEEIE